MVFDKPQWRWVPSAETKQIAGFVHNTVRIIGNGVSDSEMQVEVPTDFFKFLADVLKYDTAQGYIDFYLELYEGHWLFGYEVAGGKDMIDLWSYGNHPPKWAAQHVLCR